MTKNIFKTILFLVALPPERKDIFADLPEIIDSFCSLHGKVTSHRRQLGTDTYLCEISHEYMVIQDGSGFVVDMPPNAGNKHLQGT